MAFQTNAGPSVVQPDRFRTTDVRVSALNPDSLGPYVEGLGGVPERPKAEAWKEKSWES